MIELQNITKSYVTRFGRKYVFKNLNAVFPEHKNIGILGANGSGKSTLLRLIGSIDYADSGKVITDKKISWPIGYAGGFNGNLTGRDNIKFACRVYSKNSDIREKINFIQKFADIGEYFDLPVNEYSTIMKAKLAFGLSMAFDFDYYLVDERTSVGDNFSAKKSENLFLDMLKKANIIMASTNPSKLERYCKAGAVINDCNLYLFDKIKDAVIFYKQIRHDDKKENRD